MIKSIFNEKIIGDDKAFSFREPTISLLADGSPGIQIEVEGKIYVLTFKKAKELANTILKLMK